MKLSILHILFINLFITIQVYAQSIYYQDAFHGGVCFAGFSTGLGYGSGSFDTYIESGSVIKNVFLIYNVHNEPPISIDILLDGVPIEINNDSYNGQTYFETQFTTLFKYKINIKDITSLYQDQVSHTISIPDQSILDCGNNCAYRNFGIIVLYENPALSVVHYSLILNAQDLNVDNASYSCSVNPINVSNPVGFSLNSDIIASPTTGDGSFVFFEGQNLGLIGGADNVNQTFNYGTRGHFYYQNDQLFGLDDDTEDNVMSNSDALADVSGAILSNTSVNWQLDWQNSSVHQNVYTSFILTYTSPCDTFSVSVPNDTTLCYGETLQLNVSVPSPGPQTAYEWTTSTGAAPIGLSCSDCPDPIFTADSSMFYTVRIWNNDSCSVVRPLKITVSKTQIDSLDVSLPNCGASNGSIVVYAHNTLNDTLSFSVNGTSTGSATVGLAEGSYTISVQDAMGCPVVDSTIVLNAVNNTVAQFALNPDVGNVPLEIDVYNQSQNATEYEWYINGVYAGNNLGGYTIEDGGEYVFELVAWQYDPSCADTFSVLVWASEVIIPTAFTPNNDGDNDVWELVNLDAHFPKNKVKVFNRWGNLLFESKEGNYATNPWNGTYNGEPVPVGSYYFIIETYMEGVGDFKGNVTVIRE